MSEWWRVLMQHCNTATRQRDKDTVYRQVLEPILAAKILIFADIGKLFVLFFLFARLFVSLSCAQFALPLSCARRYSRSKIQKNRDLFCILLAYSYLCSRFQGVPAGAG